LNPRPPECKAKTYGSGDSLNVDWLAFKEWLLRNHKRYVAQYMVSYARQYKSCLDSGDLSCLFQLSSGKKRLVMSSLSALSKYLGVYDYWKRLIRQYQLKWSGKSKDEIVIARLTKVQNPEEVFEWIKAVKKARPDYEAFMDFIAITGLRFIEAVTSYNLIRKLEKEGKLYEYYDSDKEVLEHYKFKELFLRKAKKVFVSFVPREVIERIIENGKLGKSGIQTAVKRLGLPLRFGDVREVHGTLLLRYLSESEVNFLHGRISGSVFMTNYFNPKWITDLKQRVFKGITEIQNKISTS